jgi:hypothetical protein
VHLLISIILVLGFCFVIVVALLSTMHDLLGIAFSPPPVRRVEVRDSDVARAGNCEQSIISEL